METLKTCQSCKTQKEILEFFKWKCSKDGFRNTCKICSKAYIREWRKLHPYKILNNMRAYNKRHPLTNNGLNTKSLELLYKSHPYCEYCKIALSMSEASLDHIVPMSRGGTHSLDNVVISCIDCNYLKGIKTRQEFRLFIKEYISRFKDNTELSSKRESATVNPEIMDINALAS